MPGMANGRAIRQSAASSGSCSQQVPVSSRQTKPGRGPVEQRTVGDVSTVSLAAAARCPNRSTGQGVSANIVCVEEALDTEVTRLRQRKELLQKGIAEALAESSPSVDKHIEVVGSTSWDGDVPQSDLDLVLFAKSQNNEPLDAVALLEALRASLNKRTEALGIKRLELLAEPRVPILRMSDAHGLSCDVSVNQHRTLRHRDFLLEALEGRPQVRSMIRLVKHWVRRRALPMAAEGGLPSLAWAILALALANEQPEGTSVEVLLLHFFAQLRQLGEQWLCVTHDAETGEPSFEWQRRSGQSPWAEEWVQLFWLEDPTMSQRGKSCRDKSLAIQPISFNERVSEGRGLTPPSIPAALGMLYVAEVKLAWRAIREGLWDELWRPTSPEVRMPLPSYLNRNQAPLQILLKDGVVQLAQLVEVRKCPNHQHDSVLHRRDQSSELVLQPCSLVKEASGPPRFEIRGDDAKLHWQPCHWICALPTWNQKVLEGDGLSRLGEISLLSVRVAGIAADLNLWEAANPGQRPLPPHQNGSAAGEQALMQVPMCQMGGLAWVPWQAITNVDSRYRHYSDGSRDPYPVGPMNFVHGGCGRQQRQVWAFQPASGQWMIFGQAPEQPCQRRKKGDKGEATSDDRASGSTAGKLDERTRPETPDPELPDDSLLTALRAALPPDALKAPSENHPRNNEALSSDAPGHSDHCPMRAHSDESTRASDSDVDDAQRTDGDSKLSELTEGFLANGEVSTSRPRPQIREQIAKEDKVVPTAAMLAEDSDERAGSLKGDCGTAHSLVQERCNAELVQSAGSDQDSQTNTHEDVLEELAARSRPRWSLVLALNLDAPRWCV